MSGALIALAACTGAAASPASATSPSGAPLVMSAPAIATQSAVAPSSTRTATPVATTTSTSTACKVDSKLVPTCGVLWGAAAGGFTSTPRDQALYTWEKTSGRPTSMYHTYHSGDQLFPTKSEIAVAHQAGHHRLLVLNWKVDAGTTWAKVAAGAQDKRIDREAAYLKKTFTDGFYLVIHHEPEDDVKPTAGSGETAADFAAMFRHTVTRLRADGVKNAKFVVAYMNNEKWFATSWWKQLYPGDAYVDWIGVDTYLNASGGYHSGDFASQFTRTSNKAKFPGIYPWATKEHPSKPFMLAEWGVYGDASRKASVFNTVLPELSKFPALKAMVYFDTPKDQGGRDIRIDSSASSAAAFRKVAASSVFTVAVP
jgi:beta-mannanase